MAEEDPFSKVYDGLWGVVERNVELEQYLRPRNRIKYDEQADPKLNVSDSDVPELALLQDGGRFDRNTNTTTRGLTRGYIWALSTGDYRINPIYNKISFELYRCLIDFEKVLCAITWQNCRIISDCRLISIEEGTFLEEQNRGLSGWSGLWKIEVDFNLPITYLRIP